MQKCILQVSFLVVAFLCCLGGMVRAQDTATLTGTIRDNTGAVIPDVRVTVVSTATGEARQFTTNSSGEYVAAALPPGHYDITVPAKGFRTYTAKNVTLRVAQNARIDITLQVGDIRE